ncbi:Lrp/AsnC family transcriptional regulator [Thalassobius sp. I31.1]|uniref:Lrp/AsnC family transcriptional regulator n=1 Tax=Thalassobius sp. I31.1 TaxID=2109912 RepID=UPI000D19F283|nr:Lrp/AsnC family transcriptional regulator [Thalassobius sp. I31.1]
MLTHIVRIDDISAMDEIDHKIIELLSEDARMATSDIARMLSVSRATVSTRIDRLRDRGVIRRFTVELGENEDSGLIPALLLIRLKPGDSWPVVAKLKKIPGLRDICALNGTYDLAAEIVVGSLSALDDTLAKIRMFPDVAETNCSVRLRRFT